MSQTRPPAAGFRRRPAVVWMAFVGLVFLAAAGCAERMDTVYGQRKGVMATRSVNGTVVLGEMFEQAGHKIFSWFTLSPRLEQRAQCIVWFPDDFQPPSEDVCEWLEDWLLAAPGRTLIYVGRDFDAAVAYWRTIRPGAPADQQAEVRRRLSAAKGDFRNRRGQLANSDDCRWFSIEGRYRPRTVRSLQGEPRWLEGVDPSQIEIELAGRLVPPEGTEVLLRSKTDVLVARKPFPEEQPQSQLIVVQNGSFLLNLQLVNHEHRKLAGKLIDQVGPPGQTVVFLESYPGGPLISDQDPSASTPSGLKIFNIWPTNWILMQLAITGIIFCFWRFPIFGRPHQPEPDALTDFGKHIQALGELLQHTGDRGYATTRLLHYQQTTRPGE